AQIDAKIPELLNGAWDDIQRNGPAAAEKAANWQPRGELPGVGLSLRRGMRSAKEVWHGGRAVGAPVR
ncbi:hypothetical protein, partial [Kitasatospora cineracea]|uniref:hypothetical protein n=1 Tax=Kitasatospora cineracea TaxID=88074 RepID=UPI0033F602C9